MSKRNVWKRSLKEGNIGYINAQVGNDCIINIQGIRQKLKDVSTKEVYWYLVSKINERPKSESKWEENTNFQITEEMWNLIYTNDIKVTLDTTIRNFQYKITYCIIACP